MKKMLITGAAGFIGANLVRHFMDSFEVHALVRDETDTWRIDDVRDRIILHTVDITDAEKLKSVVGKIRPEYIIHTAVYGSYPTQKDTSKIVNVIVHGTINLIEACKQHPFICFVNTGTNAEYGKKSAPMREDDPLEPNTDYGIFKAAMTLYCQKVAREEHLPITTLRLISAYGPYEEQGRLFTDIMTAYASDHAPKLSSPKSVRGFTYIEDICEAFAIALQQPDKTAGEIFNVSAGEEYSIEDAVKETRKHFPMSKYPEYGVIEARSPETMSWVADNKKFCTSTGWRPKHTFAEGIRKTALWYKENAKRGNS
jgi:nucleoside-diphosphate-sugar epimerase